MLYDEHGPFRTRRQPPYREPRSYHKGLFGGGAKAPKPSPPIRMPDRQDPSLIAATRRRREQMAARGGRASTFLSDAIRSVSGSRGQLGQ